MITKTVHVTISVPVTVDETKFTEGFLAEYRESFYPWMSIDDHLKHLAQMYARELISGYDPEEFVEGYGPLSEFGVTFGRTQQETEIDE